MKLKERINKKQRDATIRENEIFSNFKKEVVSEDIFKTLMPSQMWNGKREIQDGKQVITIKEVNNLIKIIRKQASIDSYPGNLEELINFIGKHRIKTRESLKTLILYSYSNIDRAKKQIREVWSKLYPEIKIEEWRIKNKELLYELIGEKPISLYCSAYFERIRLIKDAKYFPLLPELVTLIGIEGEEVKKAVYKLIRDKEFKRWYKSNKEKMVETLIDLLDKHRGEDEVLNIIEKGKLRDPEYLAIVDFIGTKKGLTKRANEVWKKLGKDENARIDEKGKEKIMGIVAKYPKAFKEFFLEFAEKYKCKSIKTKIIFLYLFHYPMNKKELNELERKAKKIIGMDKKELKEEMGKKYRKELIEFIRSNMDKEVNEIEVHSIIDEMNLTELIPELITNVLRY